MSVQMDNFRVDAVAAGDISIDLLATELVEHARSASTHSLGNRFAAYLLASGFLAGAVATAALAPALRGFSPVAAIVAVLVFAAVSRVTFEVANGLVLAMQLVVVPMLFALPARDVPLLIAAGYLVGQAPEFVRGRVPTSQWPIFVFSASFTLGPALVLSLAHAREPRWRDAPIYLAAFAAQFAADFVPNAIWSRHSWGITPLETGARDAHVRPRRLVRSRPSGSRSRSRRTARSGVVFAVLPLVWLLHVLRAGTTAPPRPRARAVERVSRDGDAARRDDRGGRRVHGQPQPRRRRPRPRRVRQARARPA